MSQLDAVIEKFSNQQLSPPELFNALLSNSVYILSQNDSPDQDSLLQVQSPRGLTLVPVFSTEARVGNLAEEANSTAKMMAFSSLLELLPDDAGILINFQSHDIEVGPNGIKTMKESGGAVEVPAGMAQLFAEDEDDSDDSANPWWKFW